MDELGLPGQYLLGDRTTETRGGNGRAARTVSQDEVDRLSAERRPSTPQAGWDVVFRPPKSYSILWAVGGHELGNNIKAIHDEAVDEALAYLEDAAATARTTTTVGDKRTRVRVETTGFIAAAFDHRDSRAGDPLLHTHVVVANSTRRPDGSWAALEPRGLYRQALAADGVYQATFRHLAERRLGIASDPVVNGWADASGVPRHVVEHFSKRSVAIEAELARIGAHSASARQAAALATRDHKQRDHDTDLHERWRAEAEAIGFDADAVARCLGTTKGQSLDGRTRDVVFANLAGPNGLTDESATFTRSDVIAALSTAFGGAVRGADLVHLADAFCARSDVLPLAESRPGHRKSRVLSLSGEWTTHLAETTYTTSELAQIEADLMACAVADSPTPVVDEAVVDDVLRRRADLNAEQRQMVRVVCATPTAIRSVVGYPGSGKTYATEAVVAALVDSGIPVLGCAVTAEASDELARQTGLATRRGSLGCDTIAKVLGDLDHPEFGGLPSGTVVLVDEASTVSHRDLHRLARHAERAGGALVLIGDPHQHSAVGPGNFFDWLVQQGPTATLISNNRQRDLTDENGTVVVSLAEERKASVEFREGQVASSLARRDADGKVTRADTAAELYDRVVDDWFADWQQGGRDPMIATRNEVRAELSTRARSRLAAAGLLQGVAVDIGGQPLQVGDVIVTRRNNRRLRSTNDPAWFVKNGSRGTVVGIDGESGDLTVRFDGHDVTHDVLLPNRWAAASTDGRSHVEYGYAVTDYGVQGRTLDVARSVIDDSTSVAGAYVATTRGRYANRLYVVEGRQGDRGLDSDITHDIEANSADRNLDHVAERLAGREDDALIHEMDPRATAAGRLALTSTLQELEGRLAGVERRLAAAPPDVSRRIAGADRRLDELTTRRRARSSGLTFGERRELDAQISTLQGRLVELCAAQDDHDAYRGAHEQVYDRRDLLRAAIEARSTRVRLTAPTSLGRLLPQEDDLLDRSARAERRGALEELALWSDRQGLPPAQARSITDVLGPRPTDPDQRDQWARAADAARHVDPRAAELVPELALDLIPPL
ncbi:MAG: MobF family relaxase [Ilumatobacteraceae bacterium]